MGERNGQEVAFFVKFAEGARQAVSPFYRRPKAFEYNKRTTRIEHQ